MLLTDGGLARTPAQVLWVSLIPNRRATTTSATITRRKDTTRSLRCPREARVPCREKAHGQREAVLPRHLPVRCQAASSGSPPLCRSGCPVCRPRPAGRRHLPLGRRVQGVPLT